MRPIFVFLIIAFVSCSTRFQELNMLMKNETPIDVSFNSSFLKYRAEMELFAKEDEQLTDSLDRIVFTGSSSIRMWHNLATDMDTFNYTILNRGFGGSTLADVNYYYKETIQKHQPTAVVLYCGENDITAGLKAQDVFNDFYTFLRLLMKNNPNTQLLYVSMKPSPARWKLWPEFKKGNQLIEQYIKRLHTDQIQYVDISKVMLDNDKTVDGSIFLDDQLHMNKQGYERWVPVLERKLLGMLE